VRKLEEADADQTIKVVNRN